MSSRPSVHSLFFGVCIVSFATWLLSLWIAPTPPNVKAYIHEIFFVTGLLSWGIMSTIVVLSARTPIVAQLTSSPLDSIYRAHKYWGIVATVLAAVHWATKTLFAPVINALFTLRRPPAVRRIPPEGLWETFWQAARTPSNELAIVFTSVLFVLIAVSLWKKVRYSQWFMTHRLLPIAYLGLVPHCIRLMETQDYANPMGWFNIVLTLTGTYYAIVILLQKRGAAYRTQAHVVNVQTTGSTTRLTLKLAQPKHFPAGSFCFAGPCYGEMHPFSLACQNGDNLTLWIKDLGDFTHTVSQIKVGTRWWIEGPWGHFQPDFSYQKQLWCATGIGIAPFVAWLDRAQRRPHKDITLLWWVRDRAAERSRITYLQTLAQKAQVQFRVIERKEKAFDLTDYAIATYRNVAVCGSPTLRNALEKENPAHMQYEYFTWR